MRAGVNHGLAWIALAAVAITATGAASDPQPGQNHWVPSLAITSGATLQGQSGTETSEVFDSGTNTTRPLRGDLRDDDRAVSPFVGAALELMSPALPLPGSPRFFASGEFLPMFAAERQIVNEGEPSVVSGPEINSVLALKENDQYYLVDPNTGAADLRSGPRPPQRAFFADEAKGQGSRMVAQVGDLAYGAKAGVAFSFSFAGRQLRIKPSVGWMQYEIETRGYLVHATCFSGTPSAPRCTKTYDGPGDPTPNPGYLRGEDRGENGSILKASDRGILNGIGPGIDLEMYTGRFGPIGTSLFIGIHSYYIPGDRDIDFGASKTYDDLISQVAPAGPETESVAWHMRAEPWVHRGAVGIRFEWLGSPD